MHLVHPSKVERFSEKQKREKARDFAGSRWPTGLAALGFTWADPLLGWNREGKRARLPAREVFDEKLEGFAVCARQMASLGQRRRTRTSRARPRGRRSQAKKEAAWVVRIRCSTVRRRCKCVNTQCGRSRAKCVRVAKEGETVNEFGIRITALATNLCSLGDNITDAEVVKKLLQVVPDKLNQPTVSLEMFLDLNVVMVKEVVGRLRVFEERTKPKQVTDAMGRLMLCEEDWEARRKVRREQENSGGSAGSSNRGKHRGCGRRRGRGGAGPSSRDGRDGQNASVGNTGGGRPPPGDRCKNCGKTSHWAKDCRGKKKDASHVTHAKEEEEGALMYIAVESETRVHLDERKVLLHLNNVEEKEAVGTHR
ncbi:uncharacterized protein [Miscanthus floridulus]|uniref:uncharacterized protein n=1 Tax=Miscanthus floridulus TaxID=154761 RepID=UPI0034578192